MLAALLRPAAAFGGAGVDRIALSVDEAAEDGDHQPPGVGVVQHHRIRQPPLAGCSPWVLPALTPAYDRRGCRKTPSRGRDRPFFCGQMRRPAEADAALPQLSDGERDIGAGEV